MIPKSAPSPIHTSTAIAKISPIRMLYIFIHISVYIYIFFAP